MTSTKPEIQFLFEADFSDGTTYHQDVDDTSLNYPPDADGNGKSAFADVMDRIEDVIRFHLVNGDQRTTVDLTNGLFAVNGQVVELHDCELTSPLKLVYYRKVRVEKDVSAKGEESNHRHYIASYHIGWQMLGKDGKNVTHVLAVVV